ncbi:MAG: hypothetical protein O2782_04965, partial [bacterium]|nr:hypothetical protein [bacterium]
MKRFLVAVLVAAFACTAVPASATPIEVSLVPPLQIAGAGSSVKGLRLVLIYGENADVSGLDLGLVSKTSGNQVGLQWGLVHLNDGNFKGLQDGFYNRV